MEILLPLIAGFTLFKLANSSKESFENVLVESESYDRPNKPDYSQIPEKLNTEFEIPVEELVSEQTHQDFINNNSLYNNVEIQGIPLKDYFEEYSKKVLNSKEWFLAKDLPSETSQYLDNSLVQRRMEIFTGESQRRDRTMGGIPTKKEIGNLFTPEERSSGYGYIYGNNGGGPGAIFSRNKEIESYRSDLKFKNKEQPFEKIMIGKGLALDPEVPASGGFQEYTRVLPENVTDYKANQLPGRVAGGKWVFSNAPTSQAPVVKNRANGYYSLCTRGPAAGKSVLTGEVLRPDTSVLLKNQNRSTINYGFGSNSLDSFLCKS